ncbi:unnamed protein product [Mycena citricolor]|uniref:DUF6534 domain-containing protein n=1 Tax=Mycena citricolor TaxID=2018698 RepID=A0AAD2H7N3_9AGAR|nr:unnamed protein product [Mycena citricolor]
MGDYDLILTGVLLLGLFFNTYLYGICTYQFVAYMQSKFCDPWWIRSVVGALFVIDTLHSAVYNLSFVRGIRADSHRAVVSNYGNPASLGYVGWTIPFTAVATSLTAIVSQIFLAHRVYLLTNSEALFCSISFLSVLGFVFGCVAGIKSGIIDEVAKFGPIAAYVTVWLGQENGSHRIHLTHPPAFQTSADIAITMCLTISLTRSKTGFRATDSVINKLIGGAIRTGLFASMFAFGDLFSFLLHRNTNLYAMFAYPIGRIYTNTLLHTLNARVAQIRETTHSAPITHVTSVFVRKEVATDEGSEERLE